MTVSIAVVHNPDYYQDDLDDSLDYYFGKDTDGNIKSDAPRWIGGMAEHLGLEGKVVTREDSLYILNGFDPNCKVPPGMTAREAVNALKPLRKSADPEALEMDLLKRDIRTLRDAEKVRRLTAIESEQMREGLATIKIWNGKLQQTKEITDEHDKLIAGKRADKVWDREREEFVAYNERHEARRQELGRKLGGMPGGQRQAVDFTFSLCKELSIVYARGSDAEKEMMRAAFMEVTADVYERHLSASAQTRDYAGVQRGETPKIIRAAGMASLIIHDTTRAVKGDPEARDTDQVDNGEDVNAVGNEKVLKGKSPGLHIHAVTANLTIDEKGKTRSLSTEELEDKRKEMDAEVHARFIARCNEMRNEKGERFCAVDGAEPHGKAVVGVFVPGVDREDVESMSGRSLAINATRDRAAAEGKAMDYSYGKLETREAKDHDGDVAEIYKSWNEHMDDRGLTRKAMGMGKEGAKEQTYVDESRAAQRRAYFETPKTQDIQLLEKLCAHKNTFTPGELRQALWSDACNHGVFDVDARMERILNNPVFAIEARKESIDALVAEGKMKAPKSEERIYVLSQAIREEMEFDNIVVAMASGGGKAHTQNQATAIIEKTEAARRAKQKSEGKDETFAWRDDQKAAISAILTTEHRSMIIKAPPGSGKTTALGAVVAFAKEQNIDHVILAPSWKAVGTAKRDANMDEGHAIQGFGKNKKELEKLKPGTMIFVDECSMVDLPDMLRLHKVADQYGFRVVQFGDKNQFAAIGRGDPMARAQELAPYAVYDLKHITRQRGAAESHREHIMDQYEGRSEDFITKMEALGLIRSFATIEQKRVAQVEFYLSNSHPVEEKELLFSTNAECAIVNGMIRKQLIADGKLGKEGASLLCEVGGGGTSTREFRTGDRMLFVKGVADEKAKPLSNGRQPNLADTADTGTVLSAVVAKDGKSVHFKVAIDGKGVIEFDSRNGASLDHCYAMTHHRSQGITINLCGENFDRNSGAEARLVGASRHRDDYAMFCLDEDRKFLVESAGRKTEKVRARDLASASLAVLAANAALHRLGRQHIGAQYGGDEEVAKFYKRLPAALAKIQVEGANALRSYAEERFAKMRIKPLLETDAQRFTKDLVAKAELGIGNYKTLDVPFNLRAEAKAAGAVWMADRGAWVAPTEFEEVLLSKFNERVVKEGTRALPASIAGLSYVEGTIEGITHNGKSLLVWDSQGICRAISMSSPILGATAKAEAWSSLESFGDRLGELKGAAVKFYFNADQASKASILANDKVFNFSLNAMGRLDARIGKVAIDLNTRGLGATVGLDRKSCIDQYKAAANKRWVSANQAAKQEKAKALAQRASQSILLAVPASESTEAWHAGADYDRAADVWFAPKNADLSALAKWECSQERKNLAVPYEEKNEAKAAGACWDADLETWYAPVGTSKKQLDALKKWSQEPANAAAAEAQGSRTLAQDLEARKTRIEAEIADRIAGTSKNPILLAVLPDRFFDINGKVDAIFEGVFLGSKSRKLFAVMKTSSNGEEIYFKSDIESHSINEQDANGFKPIDRFKQEALAGVPTRLSIKRNAQGRLGHVDPVGQGKDERVATKAKETEKSNEVGFFARAAHLAGKSVGIEFKEQIAAKARAQALADAESLRQQRASDAAKEAAEQAKNKGRDISSSIISALDAHRRFADSPSIEAGYWKAALEKIAEGGYDPKALLGGSMLIHHLAKAVPTFDGVMLSNGKFMDGKEALALVVAHAGEGAMGLIDNLDQTPSQLMAAAQIKEDIKRDADTKALAAVPEGREIRKPIHASNVADGTVLDGYIVGVQKDALTFRVVKQDRSVFYNIPRKGIFGEREEVGLEVGMTDKKGLKIKLERGVATCAFIDNPAFKNDKSAAKELAVERAYRGGFQVESTKATIDRASVQSSASSGDRERKEVQKPKGFSQRG